MCGYKEEERKVDSKQKTITQELSRLLIKKAELEALSTGSDFEREATIQFVNKAVELLEKHLGWLLTLKAEDQLLAGKTLEEIINGIEEADIRPTIKQAIIEHLKERYDKRGLKK